MQPVRLFGAASVLLLACEGGSDAVTPESSVPLARLAASAAAEPAPEEDPRPLVTLSGEGRPASVSIVEAGAPRIYSKSLRTWVHASPSSASDKIGYLRAGSSSPTTKEPAGHDGCARGWYPVFPRGFVCAGPTATLDANDPIVVATREHPPDHLRKLPYLYGTVRKPGPVYARLPSDEELEKTEPGHANRMEQWLDADGEIGASYAQHVWLGHPGEPPDPRKVWTERRTEGVPSFLSGRALPSIHRNPRDPDQLVIDRMRPKVGYSLLETFLWHGRRYGISTELEVIPTDRLRPIQGSDYHGYEIPKDITFPFAIVRHPRARYVQYQASSGSVIEAGAAPYRAAVKLSGKQAFFKGVLHYETTDGKWLSDRHASRLDAAKKMPGWATRGEKWIDVNLTKQTLVLYEGETPVFATLVSSGEAGLENPEHTTATKRGIFRIHTKHVSATMASNELGEEFELRDVPYVQYFDKQGYALHGAYWHDRFGTPKSHGCINLSPEDARRVFYWTEPQVPRGWHGVLLPLKGTVLFIHP